MFRPNGGVAAGKNTCCCALCYCTCLGCIDPHTGVFCRPSVLLIGSTMCCTAAAQGYAQLQYLEAQQLDTDEANLVAGMDVALDCVRAAEILGGTATAADVLILAAAAQAERSPAAAAAVAARLSILLQPGVTDPATGQQYSQEFVLQQYEQLADMCLRYRAPQFADMVLEAAETQKLRPSADVLNRLTLALRGKPRRGEVRLWGISEVRVRSEWMNLSHTVRETRHATSNQIST